MTRAFCFPGQGSQTVGMGKALAAAMPTARHVFEEVDDALDQHLTRLMFEGPAEDLTLTENAQPALMAVSLAVVRTLEDGGMDMAGASAFVAGHSLGEYTALTAAGSLTVADAARLLKLRGQAMQRAVPPGEGAMAALLGLDLEVAEQVAAEAAGDQVCALANDNGGGQVVVSGNAAAVERAMVLAKEKGAKRAIRLPVSAPFHCALMQPAADEMEQALRSAALKAPAMAVITNVTAQPVDDPVEIARLLVEQVTHRVRWREIVLCLRELGVDSLVEIGAGKVLTGLARRIDRDMAARAVGSPEDIEDFFKEL